VRGWWAARWRGLLGRGPLGGAERSASRRAATVAAEIGADAVEDKREAVTCADVVVLAVPSTAIAANGHAIQNRLHLWRAEFVRRMPAFAAVSGADVALGATTTRATTTRGLLPWTTPIRLALALAVRS